MPLVTQGPVVMLPALKLFVKSGRFGEFTRTWMTLDAGALQLRVVTPSWPDLTGIGFGVAVMVGWPAPSRLAENGWAFWLAACADFAPAIDVG